MPTAKDYFDQNMTRAKDLLALARVIETQTLRAVNSAELFRASLVLGVSALDTFIHQAVRQGMLESWKNKRVRTEAFLRFQIPLGSVLSADDVLKEEEWLDSEIVSRHSMQSFQTAEKIADALRLVSTKKVWEEIGTAVSLPVDDAKRQLNLIAKRRNQIVHEADADPSFPDRTWPIDATLVEDALAYIENVGRSISSNIL